MFRSVTFVIDFCTMLAAISASQGCGCRVFLFYRCKYVNVTFFINILSVASFVANLKKKQVRNQKTQVSI